MTSPQPSPRRGQLHAVAAAATAAEPTSRVACDVVIVTYQSAAHLPRLLADLRAEGTQLRLRVVVVDNDSTDATVDIARSAGVEVLETGANLGYAGALNVAARSSTPDRPVLVLNPDLSLEPGTISMLLAAAAGAPRAGIIVPAVLDKHGSTFPSMRREPSIGRAFVDAVLGRRAAGVPGRCSEMVWDRAAYEHVNRPEWATGAALLITPECTHRVGEWDAGRFFLYSEETDYFRRARAAGLEILYTPTARVRHVGGGSGSSPELTALMAVNRVRYYRKYHGAAATVVFHAIVVVHEALRSGDDSHRAALRMLVTPWQWRRLPRSNAPWDGHS